MKKKVCGKNTTTTTTLDSVFCVNMPILTLTTDLFLLLLSKTHVRVWCFFYRTSFLLPRGHACLLAAHLWICETLLRRLGKLCNTGWMERRGDFGLDKKRRPGWLS